MLLVTGASGFLGGTIAAEALASGRAVVGAVHQRTLEQPGLRTVSVDLTASSAAKELVNRLQPEWVVNCAGFANVDECERDPQRAHLLNVELPETLRLHAQTPASGSFTSRPIRCSMGSVGAIQRTTSRLR